MNKLQTKFRLLKQLKNIFPDIAWKTVQYISSGHDSDVIILDKTLIFRFPKNRYSRKILNDEIGLLNILNKRLSTAVPQYMCVSKDFSCGVYPMIKGEGLTINKYKKLTIAQRKKLAKQLATFLTELHTTPLSHIKKFNIVERFPRKELAKLHKDAKKYLYSSFFKNERSELETFFSELTSIFTQKYRKVLVHGDFSGDHFIINSNNNLEGIIDFTDKAIHDPAFDFIFLWHFGPEFVKAVYAKYRGRSKEGLVERSVLYAQASVVWNMIQSKKKVKMNYAKWYKRFKNLRAYSNRGQKS